MDKATVDAVSSKSNSAPKAKGKPRSVDFRVCDRLCSVLQVLQVIHIIIALNRAFVYNFCYRAAMINVWIL